MAALKKTLIVIVALMVLLVGIGFILPSEFRVERSVTIDAPADKVFPHLVDFKAWKNWGVWFKRDPQMVITYSGPEKQVGMMSSWKSESQGNGEMKLLSVIDNQKISYSLYFPEFEMGSTGEMMLVEQEGKTVVTWVDYGDVGANPINHYFAAMMDSMIGPDFESGLANLKVLVESQN